MEHEVEPGLYLVGTPIGNLEDMTFRAVRVLKEADLILAEDTRHSRILLQRYEISTSMMSCHKFNEASRTEIILNKLKEGQRLALISDGGMPLISDPGARVVRAVRDAGFLVTSIPGPTAVTTAVALSGWGETGFRFVGFLPPKSAARKRILSEFLEQPETFVFYESTHRIKKWLDEASEILGDRPLFIGRELTKKFETCVSGTASELVTFFSTHSVKGEFVIVMSPLKKR